MLHIPSLWTILCCCAIVNTLEKVSTQPESVMAAWDCPDLMCQVRVQTIEGFEEERAPVIG